MKRAQQPLTVTDMGSNASVALVRTRAILGTLGALLALNGALPLLGHAPVGPWSADTAQASIERPAGPAPKASPGK